MNAARRQRQIAAAGSMGPAAKPAAPLTPTPKKLTAAGSAAMGLY
jgi:hypothetical protein